MIAFALVLVAPVVYAIYLSLFQHRMIGGTTFVGLGNYAQELSDPVFWDALGRVALYLVVFVPVMIAFSLAAALALDSARLHFARFFRLAIFLPYAVPGVVAALIWGYMYGTHFGLVGNIQDFLGIALPDPFSANLVLVSIGNIMVWLCVGYNMLVFYSALRVVPAELYEAAEIDGAGTFRVIRAIKLPAIRPALGVAGVFAVIGAFQLFNEPNILKTLAPNSISSHFTPNMYAYSLAFAGQQYNVSATVAILMGLITVVVAYVLQRVATRKA
jgi:multiple sugar transport system permease protein